MPSEKTMLNWFAYEAALSFEWELHLIYDTTRDLKVLKKSEIAPCAIAIAKQLREILIRHRASVEAFHSPATSSPPKRRPTSRKFNEGYRARQKTRPLLAASDSPQWVASCFLKAAENRALATILAKYLNRALEDQLATCRPCEFQCLYHLDEQCFMFGS